MDHRAAREVEKLHLGQPAAAPDPVSDGQVDHQEPEGREDQHRRKTHPFREGADDQRGRDDGEGQLEHGEDRLGDRARDGVRGDAREQGFAEAANPGLGRATIAEGQAVADQHPDDGDHGRNRKALHEHRQHVATAHQPAVEQGEPRQGHEEHKRGRAEQPRGITAVDHVESPLMRSDAPLVGAPTGAIAIYRA